MMAETMNNGHGKHYARSGSSCAACKLLKRRCASNCIFAPHFRGDELKKFAKVHKVFGASNVSKILVEVSEEQREDAVNSLVYEAEARLHDPVYGCIGAIALLHRQMTDLQHDLAIARARLSVVANPLMEVVEPGFGDYQMPVYGGGMVDVHEFVHGLPPNFPLN